MREEDFRITGAIYIELLTSRPPPMFWKNSESFGERSDVEWWNIFEALKCVITMGEGFEETLWGLRRHFSPPEPTFVIINDSNKEE